MGRFSLIIVVGFGIIAGIMKLNHGRLGRQAEDVSADRYLEVAARHVTNSAVNLCMYQVAQNFSWRSGYQNIPVGDGTASASIDDRTTDPSLAVNEVRITATGTYAGESTTAIVRMRKSAFSEFAYFTDVEPLIYFITGDTLRGPVHTNGQFHVSGNPVFYGLVSSVSSSWYGSGSPQFKAGTDFGCPRIDLPVDFSLLEGQAQSGGMVFQGESRLEFLNDGTFNWEVIHPETTSVWNGHSWVQQINMVVDSSGNKAISSTNGTIASDNNKDVHVKGTLDGQVTILCEGNLWIDDDVLYKQNPLTDPTANDILGLISKKNVYVTDNTANRSNCTIHATIMAVDKSFTAQNYSTGSPRGTLTVIGGIVQKERGPVGTFQSGVIKTGYQKKYIFDERFLTKAPPNYPVYSSNSIVSWYE